MEVSAHEHASVAHKTIVPQVPKPAPNSILKMATTSTTKATHPSAAYDINQVLSQKSMVPKQSSVVSKHETYLPRSDYTPYEVRTHELDFFRNAFAEIEVDEDDSSEDDIDLDEQIRTQLQSASVEEGDLLDLSSMCTENNHVPQQLTAADFDFTPKEDIHADTKDRSIGTPFPVPKKQPNMKDLMTDPEAYGIEMPIPMKDRIVRKGDGKSWRVIHPDNSHVDSQPHGLPEIPPTDSNTFLPTTEEQLNSMLSLDTIPNQGPDLLTAFATMGTDNGADSPNLDFAFATKDSEETATNDREETVDLIDFTTEAITFVPKKSTDIASAYGTCIGEAHAVSKEQPSTVHAAPKKKKKSRNRKPKANKTSQQSKPFCALLSPRCYQKSSSSSSSEASLSSSTQSDQVASVNRNSVLEQDFQEAKSD